MAKRQPALSGLSNVGSPPETLLSKMLLSKMLLSKTRLSETPC